MLVDGQFYNFTLEGNGKRIPAGRYEVKFREQTTPLTTKYRKDYGWFTWHLEIQNVKNRKNIYIHVGIFDATVDKLEIDDKQWKSVSAFKRLYLKISEALLRLDEKVFITITDESHD